MADLVFPSKARDITEILLGNIIRYAGGSDPGWVVPSGTAKLASAARNGFEESSSGASLDVTIDTGEAFVHGIWLDRSSTTTVTLAASTNDQIVYVGVDVSEQNTIIVGLAAAFAADDEKMAIWTYDTDGSGVTSATDNRITEPGEGLTAKRVKVYSASPNTLENGMIYQRSDLVENSYKAVVGGVAHTIKLLPFYVYKDGEEVYSIVEGFSNGNGSVTEYDDRINIIATGTPDSQDQRTIVTNEAIDLTYINTVRIKWKNEGASNYYNRSCLIASTNKTGDATIADAILDKPNTFTTTTDELDVSGLDGECYIRVHAKDYYFTSGNESDITVYEIYLEA
jgi:hypothetical protein